MKRLIRLLTLMMVMAWAGMAGAATVAFDGADGSLSGYLFQDNARLAATNAAVGFTSVGDATFRTVLGGSDYSSRVWDVVGSVALSNSGLPPILLAIGISIIKA